MNSLSIIIDTPNPFQISSYDLSLLFSRRSQNGNVPPFISFHWDLRACGDCETVREEATLQQLLMSVEHRHWDCEWQTVCFYCERRAWHLRWVACGDTVQFKVLSFLREYKGVKDLHTRGIWEKERENEKYIERGLVCSIGWSKTTWQVHITYCNSGGDRNIIITDIKTTQASLPQLPISA